MESLNQIARGHQGFARGVKRGTEGVLGVQRQHKCKFVEGQSGMKIDNSKFCTLFWVDKSRKEHAQLPLVNIGFSQ